MADTNPEFYRAFEDRERGSRTLVLSRLQIYLPIVKALTEQIDRPVIVDVGCGRGEWLEAIADCNVDAVGVELDAGMLSACVERNLNVVQDDAVAWLGRQSDNSVALVTAFHVVEHLSFERLRKLVDEAYRVLMPGGVLIMETPNPENLTVGAHTFYLDPTHERPLPPSLLTFLPEFAGFSDCHLWRLQEDRSGRLADLSLYQVLSGVSPDYAVLARKNPEIESAATKKLDNLLQVSHGVSLSELAWDYDDAIEHRFEALSERFSRLATDFEERMSVLSERCQQQEAELAAVYNSHSWWLTGPFRYFSEMIKQRILPSILRLFRRFRRR